MRISNWPWVYICELFHIHGNSRSESGMELWLEGRAEFRNGSRAEWSSYLEVEWNLEQWKCEMGCPLTSPPFSMLCPWSMGHEGLEGHWMNLMWNTRVYLIELTEFVWGSNILLWYPWIFLISISFPFYEELEVGQKELYHIKNGVEASVIFLHFTKFLTIHKRTLPRYIYQWCSNMTIVRVIAKSIVA